MTIFSYKFTKDENTKTKHIKKDFALVLSSKCSIDFIFLLSLENKIALELEIEYKRETAIVCMSNRKKDE